ncbi:hypothetical protein Pcac1_g22253 [Phytophthora cactorum]|nr:hypothetical protein Pcac1_g22249 [Phytophthora cactorum]KAG2766423.1 hypothetical protein Pcac1_g22253 [Phytophthora cactorum]
MAEEGTFPTLVLGVAFREECDHLEKKLKTLMKHPTVQAAIGVKIPFYCNKITEENTQVQHPHPPAW